MNSDVCRWFGEHRGIIPRPSSLGSFQTSLETVLVTARSANALIGCRMLFACDVVREPCVTIRLYAMNCTRPHERKDPTPRTE